MEKFNFDADDKIILTRFNSTELSCLISLVVGERYNDRTVGYTAKEIFCFTDQKWVNANIEECERLDDYELSKLP